MEELRSKFVGSLVGLAIGDFLGAGGQRYTDDTAMMIGVAESLIESQGFDGENMAKRFLENYFREPWRGYGFGPPHIFRMIRSGRRWDENLDQEIFPGGSFGNGAAMRIAPIGLFYYDNPDKLREMAYQSSRITHSHPLGMEGAALEAYAVALAVNEETDFLEKLKEFTKEDLYKRKLGKIEKLLDRKNNKAEVIRHLGNGIEAFNSVPTAIYSFLVNPEFEKGLVYALSLGGDRDTIGAMTGAIAGAWWGIEEIPQKWRDKLENRKYIENLAEKLWQMKRGKPEF